PWFAPPLTALSAASRFLWPYSTTPTVIREGCSLSRYTLCVCFLKSPASALLMSQNVCGLRSTSGNHVDCTCTISRCPGRSVWYTSGSENLIFATSPGLNG